MSFNRILVKRLLGTVVTPSGRLISISAATETDDWRRPDWLAEKMKPDLEKAVPANEHVLPPDTVEVCAREGDHDSASDKRSHITAVAYNNKGEARTVHLATQRK
ncbi:uncharacterized protein THITE_2117949 [Thermothielavioides terrestris NRRL 8126]|uniref:Uncharacterized protein n=1 Tax=Thermothielavioides terrestris (strain ATCC 38088 / NRRL 8126) TaxID=578455 RepID=G2R692_THETT|nr:uncharacterized protein THITE_2117949 [Thermothielavioides terrestris NRRL 8126]AEO68425.1 hypothetical protein THITE_2117949 [Thermothielavioides terrestris NRRL 8126]